nr:integrase [Thermococcus sp.]
MNMEKLSEEDRLGNEPLFKFMFYTGQRMEHSLEMLKTLQKNPNKLHSEDDIVWTNAEFMSKGKKRSFIAVMPREFGGYPKVNIKKAKFRGYETYKARFQDNGLNTTTIRTCSQPSSSRTKFRPRS